MMEKRRVLLVDDEALFVSSVKDHLSLKHPDLEVETVANGREAVARLEAGDIDLVATDVGMPDLDGLGLLAYITSFGLKIPVIVLSAFVTPDLEEKAMASGALTVLDKPVDLRRLSQAIRWGLEGAGAGRLKGISLTGFLQLLQMERKTCRLEIRFGQEKAVVYVSRGEPVHALKGEGVGDQVVEEIVQWDPVEIRMQGDPWQRPRTVKKPLTHLLLASAKALDEQGQGRQTTDCRGSGMGEEDGFGGAPAEPVDVLPLEEALWNLGSLRGLVAAALVRTDDGRHWTLGTIPGGDLEGAVRHCATALEKQEKVLALSRGRTEPIQEMAINASEYFFLVHRLGTLGMILTVFDHKKANFCLAGRAVHAARRRIEASLKKEKKD